MHGIGRERLTVEVWRVAAVVGGARAVAQRLVRQPVDLARRHVLGLLAAFELRLAGRVDVPVPAPLVAAVLAAQQLREASGADAKRELLHLAYVNHMSSLSGWKARPSEFRMP